MKRPVRFARNVSAIAALAVACIVTSVAWAGPSDETVTVRAAEKAAHYTELAAFYRSLAKPGSKHLITYFTAANRADRLAQRYRLASREVDRRG